MTTDYEYGTEKYFFVRIMRHHKSHPESPSLIGSALFEIGDILGSATHTKVKRLRQGGCLFAQLEFIRQEQQEDSRILQIQMRAMNLALRNSIPWNREPDTVMELAKQRVSSTGNSWVAVWRSGPVFSSLEPTWDKAELDVGTISHGDLSWPIRISVWFYKKGHADTLLGICETTVDKLLHASMGEDDNVEEVSEKDLILTRLNNEGKEVGTIRITKAALLEEIVPDQPPPPPPPASTPSLFGGTPISASKSMGSITNGVSTSAHGLNDSFAAGSVASDVNESFASAGAPCEILLPPMIEDTPRMTRPRFKEYVDSGCEIDLCFAIDFTSSNGKLYMLLIIVYLIVLISFSPLLHHQATQEFPVVFIIRHPTLLMTTRKLLQRLVMLWHRSTIPESIQCGALVPSSMML